MLQVHHAERTGMGIVELSCAWDEHISGWRDNPSPPVVDRESPTVHLTSYFTVRVMRTARQERHAPYRRIWYR